jgi:PAS domain S-box-containing protein
MSFGFSAPASAALGMRLGRWISALQFSHWTIRTWISALVLALLVPLNLVIIGVIWHLAESASEAQRTNLQYTARSVAAAVNAKLGEYVTLAQVLSRSPALLDNDLAAFETEARRAFVSTEDGWVVVANLEGRQLINTAMPVDALLPIRNPIGLAAQRDAFETRSTVISGVQFGNASKIWFVNIEVPVFKEGVPYRALSVSVKTQSFLRLLNDQQIPKHRIATIIDRDGRIIARVPGHEQRVGQLAAEGWRKVMDQNGVFEFLSLDGDPIVSAHAPSTASGWLAGIKIQTAEMQAAVWSAIRWAAIAGAGVSIMSLLLARAISRRITRPIAEIRRNAAKVLDGILSPIAEAPREIGDLWRTLNQSAAGRLRSDQALRESEERFRGIYRHAATGIAITGLQGQFQYCNPAYVALIGYSEGELRQLDFRELIYIEDRSANLEQVRRLLSEEIPSFETTNRYVAKDGRLIWVRKYVSLLRDSFHRPKNVIVLVTDITERKQHEEQIRESNKRLQLALNAAQLGTWRRRVTKGAEVLECDARCRALLGLPDAGVPLSYEILANAILPEDRDQARTAVERALDPDDPCDEYVCEYRVKHTDGKVLWLSASGRAFFEPDPASHRGRRAVFTAGVLRDVTETYLARAARESEAQLRHLGDSLPDSVVYRYGYDAGGAPRFHYISAGIEHLNGVRVEDVLRDAGVLLGRILPEYLPGLKEAERLSAADMSDFKFEAPVRRPNGEVRWMRLQSRPQRMQDGTVIWDGLQTDITDRKRAEEAVRGSEEKLRFALDAAELGTWRWEPAASAGELQWDTRCKALFGLPPKARVTWKTWVNSILSEDRDRVEANVARALDPADPLDETACEFRVRHPDGKVLWLSSTGRAFFEPDPGSSSGRRAVFKAGVIRDVTDIRAAEAELRQSEERFRGIFEHAGTGIAIADLEGRYLSINPAFCNMLSYSREELQALSVSELVHPEDREANLLMRRRLAAQEIPSFEILNRSIARDGTPRWLHKHVTLLRDTAGKPLRTLALVTDMTDRIRAETALRESEERFRGIYENAATGIAILDMNHRFECCNPAYSKILGYSEQELRELAFLSHVHPEDRDANALQCQRLMAREIPYFDIVNRYVRKDGAPIWVEKHISLLCDAAGKPTNILTLVTDVTERKRQDDQIHLLMREVNHRSKNLLSVVQAIASQTLAANPEDFLDRFGKRVEALAANQDLLVKNAWKGVDLKELVRSQLATFEDLIGTNIDLQGPPLFVCAPAAQALGMALHELVTNAGKYGALSGAGGRVGIAWCIQRDEEGKELFVISWREYCAHPIMPPGKQGFGSSVISSMAEMSLGACVELDYPSTGVTWQLRCAVDEVVEGSGSPFPSAGMESSSAGGKLTSRRPRVLVVEDEALVAIEITHALTRAGFDVVGPARSVRAAIQFLKCSGCDAAVLDINLGGETSEAIAIELTANETPFVTLSGYSPEQHHPVFAGAPALRKPLQLQLLIAELSKCIEHRDCGSMERPGDLPIEQLGEPGPAGSGQK